MSACKNCWVCTNQSKRLFFLNILVAFMAFITHYSLQWFFNGNQLLQKYTIVYDFFSPCMYIYGGYSLILHALYIDGVNNLIALMQDFSRFLPSSNHLILSHSLSLPIHLCRRQSTIQSVSNFPRVDPFARHVCVDRQAFFSFLPAQARTQTFSVSSSVLFLLVINSQLGV